MPYIKDPEGNQTVALHKMADFTGRRVLEIGAGDGHLTWRYAEKTAQVTAIDPNPDKIAAAVENMPAHLRGRVKFITAGLAEFTPSPDEPEFDIALFGWSL